MAERTVMLRIGMNVSGVLASARAAKGAIADMAQKATSAVERNSASIDTLTTGVGALGAGLVAFAAGAVTRFAQFDKAISGVAATGEDARGSIDALREAAIKAGADTAYSAAEAANGIEQLAKAGVSSADILGGGLSGALNLAAAGEIEVGEAAEIAASAMTQFNLEGSDVGHVADLMAAGAGKAQGGVSDMGQALNQAGLIAGQVGLSIEETTGSLAAMASAGLVGSDAGTSLKTSLIALSSPSAVARKEMDRLGISAYDAQGNFIGMEALAGQLQDRLGGLTDEQRNSALATIFGSDALRTANVLYSEGAGGIAKWTSAVNDQGYAAETAAELTDNLIGDLERLGGSLDAVFIQAGSGANNGLRSIVQSTEAVVDGLGQIPGPLLSITTAIAGAGGLALLGVAGLGKLAVGAAEAKSAMSALNISTRTASLAAGALGGALAVGTLAFSLWAQEAANAKARTEEYLTTLTAVGERTAATAGKINAALAGETSSSVVDAATSYIDLADRMGIATEDLTGYILGEADARDRVTAAAKLYREEESFGGALIQARNTEIGNLIRGLDGEAESLTNAEKAAAQKARADEAAGVAAGGLAVATEGATGALQGNTEALDENWAAQMKASGAVLSLRDAENQAEAAYDSATQSLKDNGRTLDVTTEKGRANRSALDAIAASGYDLVDSIRATGGSLKDVQGAMATARERFIATARSMGMGEEAASRLADELQLIPKNVTTTATVNTGTALARIATLDNTLNRINGKVVTASVAIKQYGQAAMAEGGSAELAGRLSGQVTGGTPGRDSVNALLMPGEHVLTTSDVQALGGHAGVYAFRSSLHDSAPAYVPRMAGTGSSSTTSNVSTTTSTRSLTVNNFGDKLSSAALLRYDRQSELLGVGQ